ncbi:MAG: TonB-dependent receptor plug domain-containing protein [Candidatus Eremiobacteraeota bacterium]|nr:TonB-dependent receptor plug domain-containing protein [Candidatus Eremiobacteraeota bacterium]
MTYGRLVGLLITVAATALPPHAARAQAAPCARTLVAAVSDLSSGAPLGGAVVTAGEARATTDPAGKASLCVPEGRVTLRAAAAGYRPEDVIVPPNLDWTQVAIRLVPLTLTTIGATATGPLARSSGGGAVARIARDAIEDRLAPQLAPLLDTVPGVISNHTTTSNPASAGVQTSPNLRGALDYEKTTLLDGHPIATGRFGDYVTSYVSAYLLHDVEIVKGPSAFAPLVVNGIGGSINLRTNDPTSTAAHAFDMVSDGFGGSLAHARYSSTLGKLGFVAEAVSYETPGAFAALPTTFALPAGAQIAGVGTVGATTSATAPPGTPAGTYPVAAAQNNPANGYVRLTACCETVGGWFQGRGEVLKGRWTFSPSTVLTAAFVGTQAHSDQDAAQLQSFGAAFVPSGAPIAINPNLRLPANAVLQENEPTFEAELLSTRGQDTLAARWYSVTLSRITANAASSPAEPFTGTLALTGSAPLTGGGTTPAFAGQAQSVTIPDVYSRSVEQDAVHGGSLAWIREAGRNEFALTYDRVVSLTNAYTVGASGGVATLAVAVPAGSRQTVNAGLARATLHPDDRDALTLALYATSYASHVSAGTTGNGFAFLDVTHGEIDPRVGFTHRYAAGNAVLRLAAGASVTPPAFNVLSGLTQSPGAVYRPGATSVTIVQNAAGLRPETSFGYDLGTDVQAGPRTTFSFDAYVTTVRDQIVTTVTPLGTFAPPGGGAAVPLYASAAANAGNARFWGLEASLRRDPPAGWGYAAQGALTRAYAYDVAPSLYATAAGPVTTNLAVVPGANYTSTGAGFNGISNKAIPYAQAYAELLYRTARGGLALAGLTYYGNNNAYGVPALAVTNASLRFPILRAADAASLQLSVDNLFNVYGGSTILTDVGIPVPLVNGKVGLVNALPVGPRAVRVGLHLGAR